MSHDNNFLYMYRDTIEKQVYIQSVEGKSSFPIHLLYNPFTTATIMISFSFESLCFPSLQQ